MRDSARRPTAPVRLMTWLLPLLVVGLPARTRPAQSHVPVRARPDSLEILPVHLELDVDLDYENARLAGTARWTIENVGDAPIRVVPVQIGRLMRTSTVTRGATELRVEHDVVVYEDWPELQINQLRVHLDTPLAPGARTEIGIAYAGPIVPLTETGMRYVRDHIDRGFTILRAESYGFPQIRVASYEASRAMPRGEFTAGLRVTVPEDLVVATGTPESSRIDRDGRSTWTFETTAPIPFLLVAIAPYETLVDGGLRVYHFADDGDGARAVMVAMREALDAYARWFGPVDTSMRLHVIEIPEGWGSQADLNAGIIQTADAFRATSELRQLHHELAHLWHPTDVDPAPPRWNEGLATFLAYRMAAVRGEADQPLATTFAGLAARQVERFGQAVPSGNLAMVDYGREGMTGLSYVTGALMFYALYETLGEAEFDRALGRWFDRYRASGSTTLQFMTTMQTASGRDLDPLFDDWLTTARWYDRLHGGESLEEVIARYR